MQKLLDLIILTEFIQTWRKRVKKFLNRISSCMPHDHVTRAPYFLIPHLKKNTPDFIPLKFNSKYRSIHNVLPIVLINLAYKIASKLFYLVTNYHIHNRWTQIPHSFITCNSFFFNFEGKTIQYIQFLRVTIIWTLPF